MILDSISELNIYRKIHPAILIVCNYIENTDLCKISTGRNEIIEGRLFATKGISAPKGEEALLEVHRKFIDIQCVLDGADRIGWSPLACCKNPTGEFNSEKDVQHFSDTPDTWLNIYPSMFAIFLPTDAHAPLGGTESVNKIIFKVAVEW